MDSSDVTDLSGLTTAAEESDASLIVKDPEALLSLDWSPVEELNKKFPVGVNAAIKWALRGWFIVDRSAHFLSAAVFLVFLPILPTIVCVAKTGNFSRETLIVTSAMQILAYLNTDQKNGGFAVFALYAMGCGICGYAQNWSLNPVIAINSWGELFQYACHFTPLVNGHVLDCFLLWSIVGTGVLSCVSVFRVYGLGFEDHWFWEDVKRLCKRPQEPKQPKALEDKKS